MSRLGEPRAKLTEPDVALIRFWHHQQIGGYRTLARFFHVSPSAVRDIVRGKTWREAPELPDSVLADRSLVEAGRVLLHDLNVKGEEPG